MVKRFLLLLVSLLLAGPALAQFAPTPQPPIQGWRSIDLSIHFTPSQATACVTPGAGFTHMVINPSLAYDTCFGVVYGQGTQSQSIGSAPVRWLCASGAIGSGRAPPTCAPSCPVNSTGVSSCTCSAGFVQSGSSCVAIPPVNNCPSAGTSAGRWSRPHIDGKGVSDPYYICDGATPSGDSAGSLCVVSVVGDVGVGDGGVMVIYGAATFTGAKSATCNGSGGQGTVPGSGNATPPVQGQPAPTPCKAGTASGTVNGLTSCFPTGALGKPIHTPTKSTTTTTVDGNSPTSTGIDGSTECRLGRCVTTSTTTTTAGGVSTVSTSTKEESQGDFCQSNPGSSQCKEFTLGDISEQPIGNQTVNLSISKAGSFGPDTAACPAPKTAVIMGVSLVMPFTLLCEFAILIRPLLIGFAYLSAALTFFGFARK
jgi:hypothetical protein